METIWLADSIFITKEGTTMPTIIFEGGTLDTENKNELIKELTRIASRITRIPESSYTVLLKENPIENWGVGGEPLTEIIKRSHS
jgi:4-oxalocrotonate tautomerase